MIGTKSPPTIAARATTVAAAPVRRRLQDVVRKTVAVPAPATTVVRLVLPPLPNAAKNAARDQEHAAATCRLVRAATSAGKLLRSAIPAAHTAPLRAASSTVVRADPVANPPVDRSVTIGVRRLAVSGVAATVRPIAGRNTEATGALTVANMAIMVAAAKRIAEPHTAGDTASASTVAATVLSIPRMVGAVRRVMVTALMVVMVREDTPPSAMGTTARDTGNTLAITTAAMDMPITPALAGMAVMVADTVIITPLATAAASMAIMVIIRADMGEAVSAAADMATPRSAITAGTAVSVLRDTATVTADIGAMVMPGSPDTVTSRMAGTTAPISLAGRAGAASRMVITELPAADTVTAVIAANAGCPGL